MHKMMNMFKKNRGFRKQMERMMQGGGIEGLKNLGGLTK